MKKIIFLLLFICTSAYAKYDTVAYTNYKKTNQYQSAASKVTNPPFADMKASYSKPDNMLYWSLTLLKLESLTGTWADLGAIAKANHQDFVYTTLTPVLVNSNGEKVYRCLTIERKTMFKKDNKVRFASKVPKDILFAKVTMEFGLIADNNKSESNKEQKEAESSKLKREKERALRRAEIAKLNESLRSRGLLQEVRNDRKKDVQRREVIQKHTPVRTTQSRHSSIIMANCKSKWGTDYSMIKYCVNKQTNAYNSIAYLPNNEIMRACRNKWNTDYSMIKYCINKQSNAKRNLGL